MKNQGKKLSLNSVVVTKLQQNLTPEQLKKVVGGASCEVSGGSRQSVC